MTSTICFWSSDHSIKLVWVTKQQNKKCTSYIHNITFWFLHLVFMVGMKTHSYLSSLKSTKNKNYMPNKNQKEKAHQKAFINWFMHKIGIFHTYCSHQQHTSLQLFSGHLQTMPNYQIGYGTNRIGNTTSRDVE